MASASIQRDAHGGGRGERRADQRDQQTRAEQRQIARSAPSPLRAASTAPAPKISTGTYSGRTSSASRLPPPRKPSVSAAPIAPSSDRIGVPSSSAAVSTASASPSSAYCRPSSGASSTTGKPVVSQCASILPDDERRQRVRRQRDLLERAVGVIGRRTGAAATSSEASSAATHSTPGPIVASMRALGRRRERKERDHDHVEQQLHAEFRARAQREPEVARERPAHAGQDRAVARRVAGDCGGDASRVIASVSERVARLGEAERRVRRGDREAAPVQVRRRSWRRAARRRRHRAPSPARRESTAGARASDSRARPMRRRCPCDSTRAGSARCASRARPCRARRGSRRATRSRRRARRSDARFSSAVSSSFSAGAWPAKAIAARKRRIERRDRPARSSGSRPRRARDSPASMRSSVVLPVPFAPVTTSAWPGSTRTRAPRTAARGRDARRDRGLRAWGGHRSPGRSSGNTARRTRPRPRRARQAGA